ncbi:Anti-sigma factor antagonist, partial [Dysosmobacter welbionis]
DSERGFAPRASRETIRGNRRNAHEKSGTAFRQAQTRGDVHCVHLHPAHVCGTAAVQYHSLHSEYPLQLSEDGDLRGGDLHRPEELSGPAEGRHLLAGAAEHG